LIEHLGRLIELAPPEQLDTQLVIVARSRFGCNRRAVGRLGLIDAPSIAQNIAPELIQRHIIRMGARGRIERGGGFVDLADVAVALAQREGWPLRRGIGCGLALKRLQRRRIGVGHRCRRGRCLPERGRLGRDQRSGGDAVHILVDLIDFNRLVRVEQREVRARQLVEF